MLPQLLIAILALQLQSPPHRAVTTLMRRVEYHIDASIVMHISELRGRLVPEKTSFPVVFDDPASFSLEIDSAAMTVSVRDLAALLNRYVFDYRDAPLKGLSISVDKGRLKQSGRLHGLPFSVIAEMSVTPGGEIRLHPVTKRVIGIPIGGLMNLFGLTIRKLADVRKAPGIRIEKNDLLITPAAMLPPPHTRGHLLAATIVDSSLSLVFRTPGTIAAALKPPIAVPNFMYFRNNVIRFGHLTMEPADLLMVDQDPRDWFGFWLKQYQPQLVRGSSKVTAVNGLITTVPDVEETLTEKREP